MMESMSEENQVQEDAVSTAVATTDQAGEIVNVDELEQRLARRQQDALVGERIQPPFLQVLQATTEKKPAGVEDGEFYNTLTNFGYGSEIEFLIGYAERGRFYSFKPKEGRRRGYSASAAETTVPDRWPEQFRGKAFAELPEAEERYAEMANAGQIEWGKGPPIATTYVFVGIVTKHQGGEIAPTPVKLSLMRSSAPAGRTMLGLARSLRTPWAHVVRLSTDRKQFNDGPSYVVNYDGLGDAPADDFRQAAIQIALAAEQNNLDTAGRDEDQPTGAAREKISEDRGADKPGF